MDRKPVIVLHGRTGSKMCSGLFETMNASGLITVKYANQCAAANIKLKQIELFKITMSAESVHFLLVDNDVLHKSICARCGSRDPRDPQINV